MWLLRSSVTFASPPSYLAPVMRWLSRAWATAFSATPSRCSAHASQTAVNAVARGETQIVCSTISYPVLLTPPDDPPGYTPARSANFA